MADCAKIVQDQFGNIDDEDNHDGPNSNKCKRAHFEYKRGESSSSSYSINMDNMDLDGGGIPNNALKNIAYDLEGKPAGDPQNLEESRPECTHYERNCSIISPCCGMVFGCRLCHDECDHLNVPIFKEDHNNEKRSEHVPQKIKGKSGAIPRFSKRGSISSIISSITETGDDVHHTIDRYAIKEIICRRCFTRQSSKTNTCVKCNIQFGEYHCDICNLWMNAEEDPWHCEECGFCRVGGRDNFRHCDGCGMCIDIKVFDDHNCRSGKYAAHCPVCHENIFSSRRVTHEMPCGHDIHWDCFKTLAQHDSRCPLCKKTVHEDMSIEWQSLARDIQQQPIPPDQTRCVDISCNDCEIRDKNRRWHFLGVQCRHCGGFNTSFEIKMTGMDAYKYLNELDRKSEE